MDKMTKVGLLSCVTSLSLFVTSIVFVEPVLAESAERIGKGKIEMIGGIPKDPIDPENPEKPVDPGPGPSTDGPLRIDFVSSFNFGNNKIEKRNHHFFANAQLFHDGTTARGSYIQITDERSEKLGWTLQVRQEFQFKNSVIQEKDEQELKGATLSLDHGWANSIYTWETAPVVTKDTIEITELATTQNIAIADVGSGKGQWTIEFGASETNTNNQKNTLFPKTTPSGEAVLDSEFENQLVYGNKAVALSIPNGTVIKPVQYETELTWILAALPN
ncbi:hypothetical protein ATZ33_16945 [Enterococcus silesiacus]|uniref:WxL domain-containing protein n=1 Tax=Enterococcus silesiacus TaxID=332949 RepID=A0A0S3KFE1_9ENTE|nr:WxL domain-containing protein [Enterococcus silesiacus]ALS03004.1 hypothetical protein ATZ33_16945 [Enterococcus silesiacus]OJG92946.1 hypothetical protein RV15_GL002080 [Enterococcus silesiacus]